MEFTTPPSYANTLVNVGGIVSSEGKVIIAGATNTAEHTKIRGDPEKNWPEPEAAKYVWKGTAAEGSGKAIVAELGGPLGERLDRVDVMAELPGFVKQIAQSASGTRPYIYQVGGRFRP